MFPIRSPAGFAPVSANCAAIYSVASSPPRAPTPRPSSRSLDRNFTCARMRWPAISVIWADTWTAQGRAASAQNTRTWLRIICLRILPLTGATQSADHRDMDRVLTQQEIDNAFKKDREAPEEAAQVYDFSRTDRIAKDQLNTIHQLHENFARSMALSLSGY